MITGMNRKHESNQNESKTLTKHIPCECKCRFDGKNIIQINVGITINLDLSVKKMIYVKKIIFGILLHVILKTQNI